jgi:hypothetical protein
MDDPQSLAARYIATFNESDGGRRANLLQSLYASDGTYTDPHVDLQGPEQIADFIAQTQERFPAHTFALHGPVDAHHDQMRLAWQAGPADEPERFLGFDVIVTENGRIRSVYGFMDAAPAG